MSKEIKIDVSGCKDYRPYSVPNEDGDEFNDICDNASEESSFCYKNPSCYYKQLKRLQAENEELKKIIETQIPWHNCNNCNKDYKQALEEIREMCKRQDFNQGMRTFEILKKVDEVLK